VRLAQSRNFSLPEPVSRLGPRGILWPPASAVTNPRSLIVRSSLSNRTECALIVGFSAYERAILRASSSVSKSPVELAMEDGATFGPEGSAKKLILSFISPRYGTSVPNAKRVKSPTIRTETRPAG
jgi:hypothetical protein